MWSLPSAGNSPTPLSGMGAAIVTVLGPLNEGMKKCPRYGRLICHAFYTNHVYVYVFIFMQYSASACHSSYAAASCHGRTDHKRSELSRHFQILFSIYWSWVRIQLPLQV